MRIEIWSDVVCPWCYVGKRRLESALGEFEHADDVEVVYRSFELDPTAPHHGTELTLPSIARKYGRSVEEMRPMMAGLMDTAAEEGLELRLFDTLHTNTIDAHRLLHLALATGGPTLQRALKESLLAAYFTRAEDVGDHAVLRAVATEVGLDPARVEAVLASDEYADAVAADIAQARAYGATGVPFFVVDQRYGISGAQPAEAFSQVLERAWADTHPAIEVVAGATGADGAVCGPDGCAI
jgi:predicted DsbA family dithiol-disulfide isomerase